MKRSEAASKIAVFLSGIAYFPPEAIDGLLAYVPGKEWEFEEWPLPDHLAWNPDRGVATDRSGRIWMDMSSISPLFPGKPNLWRCAAALVERYNEHRHLEIRAEGEFQARRAAEELLAKELLLRAVAEKDRAEMEAILIHDGDIRRAVPVYAQKIEDLEAEMASERAAREGAQAALATEMKARRDAEMKASKWRETNSDAYASGAQDGAVQERARILNLINSLYSTSSSSEAWRELCNLKCAIAEMEVKP